MMLTSVLLYVITRASPHYCSQPAAARRQGLFRFTNCLWYMYGATINQGESADSENKRQRRSIPRYLARRDC